MIRTSATDPIGIAEVPAPGGGIIGMTFCPGKCDPVAMSGDWRRDLDTDLEAVRTWGAAAVVSLVEASEFRLLGVPDLGERVQSLGIEWLHLPIRDMDIPEADFERAWKAAGRRLHLLLNDKRSVLVHCRGGLGRTGTIAARLLIERGTTPDEAIRVVRAARPGAIENGAQEAYVAGVRGRAG